MNPPPNREVALFSAALELPVEQRAAYLDGACADDPELRLRLEALLRVHDEAIPFLETPPAGAQESPMGAAASGTTVRVSSSPSEKAGDRIGRYKLLQQIGEGGCGVVYMAEQEEPLRRRVALKVIKLGMDTKQVIARFEAERQALALMDHPNIAKVLEAGATDAGRPYFVMELVRGVKITDYCDQNNLSTKERLELFIQVCHAVQHAHQKGIIHRDIKPSNILVTVSEPGASGCPKVIDFGIAKATTGQRLTDKTVFTAFEQFIGTPAYMSPEQAMMTALDIDTRTDIYALGVLLYELLTGRTPLDQKELLAAGLDEMRRTICEKEPVRPSTRLGTMLQSELTTTAKHRRIEPPKLVHLLRGDLDWIVMKALEKERARRYETANALAMDIQRHLNCEPVVARPPSRLYEFQKTVRRHKFGFIAAGSVGAALLIGLGISTGLLVKERAARQAAVAAEEKAQTEAAKSKQVARFLNEMLEAVNPSVASGRDTAILQDILDRTADRIGKELTNQPEVEIELRCTMGNVYQELGDPGKAEPMYRRALELSKKLWGDHHTNVAEKLVLLAHAVRGAGRAAEAETTMRQALAMQYELLGKENQPVADTLHSLAYAIYWQAKPDQAEPLCRESLRITRKLVGSNSLAVAERLHLLGFVVGDQHRLSEGEAFLGEALTIQRKLLPGETIELANTLQDLGGNLRLQHRLPEAEAAHREAMAIRRKLMRDRANTYIGVDHLANVLLEEGKLAEAESLFREAQALRSRWFGRGYSEPVRWWLKFWDILQRQDKLTDPATLQTLSIVRQLSTNNPSVLENDLVLAGALLRQEKKYAEAETLLRVTVANARQSATNDPVAAARPLLELGAVLQEQGKFTEAETLAREALADALSLSASDQLGAENLFAAVGIALRQQNKHAEAETPYREALAIARRLATNDLPRLECRIMDLGIVLSAQGKFTEAELLFREAGAAMPQLIASDPSRLEAWSVEFGYALRGQQKFPEAETHLREALATAQKFPANAPSRLDVRLADVGDILRSQKKNADAEPFFKEALASARQFNTNEPARVQVRVNDVADILRRQGRLAEAEAIQPEPNVPTPNSSGPAGDQSKRN